MYDTPATVEKVRDHQLPSRHRYEKYGSPNWKEYWNKSKQAHQEKASGGFQATGQLLSSLHPNADQKRYEFIAKKTNQKE